jgi:hypothetical protein
MSDATSKPCTRCCEPIPLGALRCPRCQSWQSLWDYITGDAQAKYSLIFLPLMLIPMIWFWPRRGADFAAYRDQIEILESQLRVQDKGYAKDIVTLGRLRNNSPVKWKDVCFEVQFFDAEGKLVGAKSAEEHEMVLLPGSEHAFQVTATAEAPPASYASQKIYILDARDARRWP